MKEIEVEKFQDSIDHNSVQNISLLKVNENDTDSNNNMKIYFNNCDNEQIKEVLKENEINIKQNVYVDYEKQDKLEKIGLFFNTVLNNLNNEELHINRRFTKQERVWNYITVVKIVIILFYLYLFFLRRVDDIEEKIKNYEVEQTRTFIIEQNNNSYYALTFSKIDKNVTFLNKTFINEFDLKQIISIKWTEFNIKYNRKFFVLTRLKLLTYKLIKFMKFIITISYGIIKKF
jgi:hypothetical protein